MNPRGRRFWFALVAGWAIMAFGVYGTMQNAGRTHPGNFALWFTGSALAHDLLLAPAVFLVALAIGRWLPAGARSAVQVGLIVAGTATVVALPFILGLGGAPDNPSALPRNYAAGLAIIVGSVAAATLLTALLRRAGPGRRPGRREPPSAPPSTGRSRES